MSRTDVKLVDRLRCNAGQNFLEPSMAAVIAQRVKIVGRRIVTRQELENDPLAVSAKTEEFLDAFGFAVSGLTKVIWRQEPEIHTEKDFAHDRILLWISATGYLVDEESCGSTEWIEI